MQQITSDEAFRAQILENKPTVVIFKTTWCRDCHYIEPFMPELIDKYRETLSFVQIDRDDLPDLCSELHILGIPSFIVFVNGVELTRFVSKLRKTREEIETYLDQSLEVAETYLKAKLG